MVLCEDGAGVCEKGRIRMCKGEIHGVRISYIRLENCRQCLCTWLNRHKLNCNRTGSGKACCMWN